MSTPPSLHRPPGVESAIWTVRGSRRAVLHTDLAGAGEVVVLVPGFTGSKEDFLALLPLIAAGGRAAVAYDQLGQYQSDGSDRAEDYSLDALAADLAEVAAIARAATSDADAVAVHVVGHSFGGLVVQAAVADDAIRPTTLTLLCSGPGALPEDRWQNLPALIDALDEHDLATIWQIMREMDDGESAPGAAPPPADVAAFLEERWHANHPVGLAEFARMLMTAPDRSADLAPMSAAGLPVTVMCGDQDDAWPVPDQLALAARIGARTVVLPGLGHSPNTQAPEVTADALAAGWTRAR